MSRHLNRLNNEEAAEFDRAFEEFCSAENKENKMNTDFFLTIHRELVCVGRPNSERKYYMVICGECDPTHVLFSSYKHPVKADMIEVGKAYAKRLNIVYREGDVE